MFPNRQPNNNRAFDAFGNEIYDPFGTAQNLQQQQQQQPQQQMFGGFGFQQPMMPMMQMPQMQPMMQMPMMQMPMMQQPFGNFGFPNAFSNGGATTSFSSSSFSSGGNGGQGFVTTTTSSMGPGGVMETKTIARDSSGKKKVVTKRQIGDKAVEEIEEHDGVKGSTRQRKIENLGVEDLNLFDSEWSQRKAQLPQISSTHHGMINGQPFDDGVRALPGSTGPTIQMLEDGQRRKSKTQNIPHSSPQTQKSPQNGSSLHRSNATSDVGDDITAESTGDGVIRASAVEEPEFIPTEVINNTAQQQEQQKENSARRHYQQQSNRGGVVIQEIEDFDESKPD